MSDLVRRLVLAIGVSWCAASAAEAITIPVTTTADDTTMNGNCTLREAIIAANSDTAVDACTAGSGSDVIQVPAGTYAFAIGGRDEDAAATGDLDVTEDVEIVGAGAGVTIVDANGGERVFDIDPGSDEISVVIRALSITGGYDLDGDDAAHGGGLRNAGTLLLDAVEIAGNIAHSTFFSRGGGIANTGTLTILGCIIRGNTSEVMAFFPGPSSFLGGGIWSSGPLEVVASTVEENSAFGYGLPGNAAGGGIYGTGDLIVTRSTIARNAAGTILVSGGFAGGGGVLSLGSLTMTNSTVSENFVSVFGSGSRVGGGLYVDDATIANSTITGNDATAGDAVAVRSAAVAIFRNSIVDGGCDTDSGSGTIVGDAYNLAVAAGTSCAFTGTDLVGVDPMLGSLEDNGGPTFTHALLTGSPALEAGNPADPGSIPQACSIEDQRGVPRPQRMRCDIGAYESNDGIPDAFKCYKAGDLRDPPFVPVTLDLTDQLASQTDVSARKPYLVCNPADMGTGVRNSVDHLACYKIRTDRLDPPVDVEVSDVFGTTRLQISAPKALCVRSTKQVLP